MRHRLARLAALVLVLGATGCGGDGPDFIWLRAVHGIPDAPSLRLSYDDFVFRRTLTFAALTSETPETLLGRFGSSAILTVEYLQPDGSTGGTLLTREVPVEQDSTSTVVLAGSFDDPQAMIIVSPRRARPLAAMYFQFAHAAPDVGALDVYVTAPETGLEATAPSATLQPLGHTESFQVPFGKTRIRLVQAGTLEVVMDTGELTFGEVSDATGPGSEWFFAITPSVAFGPSPLNLAGTSGRNSASFLDVDTPAVVRALHAVQAAPAMDLLAVQEEDGEEEPAETLLYSGLSYGERSPPVAAPFGSLEFEFRPTDPPGEAVATRNFLLGVGVEYVVHLAEGTSSPQILIAATTSRSVATEARLQFANLALDSDFFSVYLTATEDETRGADNRIVQDLRYTFMTDRLSRAPGEYFITLTERFFENANQASDAIETVTIGPLPLTLQGGDVLTFAILPPDVEGEAEVLQIFDDRLP